MRILTQAVLGLLLFFSQSAGNTQFQEISGLVQKEIKQLNLPSVVVGITNADNTVYLEAFGDAHVDNEFLIGSNSKSFTALGILLLEQKGLLKTQNAVIEYLPWFEFKEKSISDKVTIQDLLNHTSGIARPLGMHSPANKNIIEYYKSLLKKVTPEKLIGSDYEYSNLNYQILGLIIEKVTTSSYSDFVQSNILFPLHMKRTFTSYNDIVSNKLIDSYQYLTYYPLLKKNIKFNNYEIPSGFISSNASDMCMYLRSLMKSNSIISSTLIKKLFAARSDINSKYACGWEVRPWKEIKRFKHDGLTQSFASSMLILPEQELGIIVLTNVNNSPATLNIADGIMRILNKEELVNYRTSGFYMRNSLPFFALWIIILLFFRLRKWFVLKKPVSFKGTIKSYFMLVAGLCFGLIWIIYLPARFNTPLSAIIDYEPNSGISLIVLSSGICVNSIISFFVRNKVNPAK